MSGRSAVRSVTVRGRPAEAQRQRELLAARTEALRAQAGPPLRTLADLLTVWLEGEHDGKPSTGQNYRVAAARLACDPLAARPEPTEPADHDRGRHGLARPAGPGP